MSVEKEIGEVEEKQTEEGVRIEWKIPNFSSIAEDKSPVIYASRKFTFEGGAWTLQMTRALAVLRREDMYLVLSNISGLPEYQIERNYGFKKLDNSMEQIGINDIESKHSMSFPSVELSFLPSEVMRRKTELLPSDFLTIVCILKQQSDYLCIRVNNLTQPAAKDKSKHKKLTKLDILSENFRTLFINKDNCDVTLRVKDKDHQAHKAVLIARSSVFAAMFHHDSKEKQTGVISIPDCDSDSFKEFLEYLYCGKLEELSSSIALHLYETSDKYDVQELKIFCVESLMEKLTLENLCDVVVMADKYDDTKLLAAAQSFFNRNLNSVLVTSQWECLLKSNYRLANKLLIEMSSKVKDFLQSMN